MIAAVSMLLNGCVSSCFYYPSRDVYQTPARVGLTYEDIIFKSEDGTRLSGWFVPAAGRAKGTVIFFHGNALNIAANLPQVDWLPGAGFNVFIFDYRGYGLSGGKPGRTGVYEDSVAALTYVKSRTDIDQDRLLVYGQSLGGAQAIAAVGNNAFKGIRAVVSDSTFYSYRSLVRDKISEIPVLSLLRWPLSFLAIGNKYSPGDVIDRIAPVPLLLIHGTADSLINIRHARWLLERARDPKALWIAENARHCEVQALYGDEYRKRLVHFFEQALKGSKEDRGRSSEIGSQP